MNGDWPHKISIHLVWFLRWASVRLFLLVWAPSWSHVLPFSASVQPIKLASIFQFHKNTQSIVSLIFHCVVNPKIILYVCVMWRQGHNWINKIEDIITRNIHEKQIMRSTPHVSSHRQLNHPIKHRYYVCLESKKSYVRSSICCKQNVCGHNIWMGIFSFLSHENCKPSSINTNRKIPNSSCVNLFGENPPFYLSKTPCACELMLRMVPITTTILRWIVCQRIRASSLFLLFSIQSFPLAIEYNSSNGKIIVYSYVI